MSETITQRLAAFTAPLTLARIPPATVHTVRRHLLDTLGAGLAGATQPEAVSAVTAARRIYGAAGPSIRWGTSERMPPAAAALVNGIASAALELDDAHGCDHSGAVVIPAVLASLPLAPPDSAEDDLIAAIVVGYDVGRRVMEACGGYDGHNGMGWHSTGTCGVFGAAAAVARLHRLTPEATVQALGIAGSLSSGNWSFITDGAVTKRLHPGNAAAMGLLAVDLALSGFTGPAQVFEAPWGGFFNTYARGKVDADAVTRGLGEEWRIDIASIKPFASCRSTHAAIEACLGLRNDVTPERLDRVEVAVHPLIVDMCGGKHIVSRVDAQMSLPYTMSLALLRGRADLTMFEESERRSEDLQSFLCRVDVVGDPAIASSVAARVTLGEGGRTLVREIESPLGAHDNRLDDDGLRAKFRQLAALRLGAGNVEALEAAVWRLGAGGSAGAILAGLNA